MKYFFLFLLFSATLGYGQTLKKTIRGTITDKETFQPLIGAKVILVGSDPLVGAITDLDGNFRLENVPVGRQAIQVTYIGYEPYFRQNIDLSSKDIILTIEMVEDVTMMNKVEVQAQKKGEIVNKMATVSTRAFSIEETNRYAGSLNDVARMAQNFAGVQGANDSRNDIIIRGNSPTGVLYRMDGIDIPNPNHFARFGTTGGPVSMLNNNMMANSDFLTGAFPAEYGNAIAGVFDLKLRSGNNENHEFMFQFGFNGAELMAEGPISKKSGASYVVNYRYSTLQLFKLMGINFGSSALPEYQDASFKLNFPHKKGVTSIFGMGGVSAIDILAKDADSTDLFAIDLNNTLFRSRVGIVGLTHKQRIGKKSYLNISLGLQASYNRVLNDSVDNFFENPFTTYSSNSTITKQSVNAFFNKKINAKQIIKFGFRTELYFLNLNDSFYNRASQEYQDLRDFKGNTFLWQPYAQYQLRPTENITLNIGLHSQSITLNNKIALEPRLGAAWKFTKKDRISLGYGLHSQMQPIEMYYYEQLSDGMITRPNNSIDFTKSHHLILGYQHQFKKGVTAKVETYYQHVYNAPIEQKSSTFSMLNFGADFVGSTPDSLIGNGTGTNYGAELTIEKYLNKGFYFLVTSSIYESKYTPSNKVEYNTAFNGNYTFNALIGYELMFKSGKRVQNSLTFDLKFTQNGGKRYTPILLDESILLGKEIRDYENAFSERYSAYIRGDIRIAFKSVGKKVTQEWAFNLQNFTNQKNVFFQAYSDVSKSIQTTYQTGLLPIGQYRIYF